MHLRDLIFRKRAINNRPYDIRFILDNVGATIGRPNNTYKNILTTVFLRAKMFLQIKNVNRWNGDKNEIRTYRESSALNRGQ